MKKVAIIGGGYGGLRAIEHLVGNKNITISLFDENSYHYLQTEVYGYIAGRFDLHDVALDLKNWCHGFNSPVEFIQEKVTFINSSEQQIETQNGKYDYDYLIIATGARTNFFSFIDGLDKYGLGVKKLFRSHNFRTSFEELLYNKLEDPKIQGEKFNLAIGGAGLSGVEIAAEMANVIKKHAKSIGESAREIEIFLIDASDTILPGMSPYIIKETGKRLENLEVKVMTKAFIDKVDENKIYFKNGDSLDYTFMIFTGGILANTIDSDLEVETNRIGQYICDENLRLKDNIFTIGDCCQLTNKDGSLLPPTAQTAERSAEYIAKSVSDLILNEPIEPFVGKVDGVFVALGGHYAVGEMFKVIKVKGYLAYLLKKLVTKFYFIGLKLRLNTGFHKRTINEED
ncbi:MAG: FAD-dependent oxidoreductase [Campylobacterales bacterium]|nr:FAD-dependent oxidoreductase [Campylobacterales bacterium]